jgi:hypothetical protein
VTTGQLSAPGQFGEIRVSAGPSGTASPADFITIGQASTGGNMILQGGAVNLVGASNAGNSILVRTAALTLGAPMTAGAGGVTLASTAGALNLGDNVSGGGTAGLDISNATFGLISTTGAITLYAGDPFGGARGDLTVGTLAVNGGNMSQLVLLADAAHDVVFTGPVTSSGATPANLVAGGSGPIAAVGAQQAANVIGAWIPNSILIEAAVATGGGPAGSIGTAAAPFGQVTFNALGDILMGTPGFIQAAQALPGSQIEVNLGSPTGPAAAMGEVILATQTATFLANGKIVQQNTAAAAGQDAGLLIETPKGTTQSLFLGCSTCTTVTSVIDLFGAIDTADGVAVTGPAMALSPQIVLLDPLTKDFQYRANGCVIGDAGDCLPGQALPILWTLLDLPPGSVLDGVFATLPEPPPLLTPGDYEGQADVTIIGSGNEEIWRKPDDTKK